jgi:hypothetical protein
LWIKREIRGMFIECDVAKTYCISQHNRPNMESEGIQMRKSSLRVGLLFALAAPGLLVAQLPQMQTVEPASGKGGDVIMVSGQNLDQNIVAALYLTNGKEDFKVEITEQTGSAIKFRIPLLAKPGRLALMVLTKGKDAKLIEEPVKVLIEAPLVGPTG